MMTLRSYASKRCLRYIFMTACAAGVVLTDTRARAQVATTLHFDEPTTPSSTQPTAASDGYASLRVRSVEMRVSAQGQCTVIANGTLADATTQPVVGERARRLAGLTPIVETESDHSFAFRYDFSVHTDCPEFANAPRFENGMMLIDPNATNRTNAKFPVTFMVRRIGLPVRLLAVPGRDGTLAMALVGKDRFGKEIAVEGCVEQGWLCVRGMHDNSGQWSTMQRVEVRPTGPTRVAAQIDQFTVTPDAKFVLRMTSYPNEVIALRRLEVRAMLFGTFGVEFDPSAPDALVKSVLEGSAMVAGVQPGDRIVAIDATAVRDRAGALSALGRVAPGDACVLKVRRGDREAEVRVTAE